MGFQKAVTWKYFPSAFCLLGFLSIFITVIHFHVCIYVLLSFLVPVVVLAVLEVYLFLQLSFFLGKRIHVIFTLLEYGESRRASWPHKVNPPSPCSKAWLIIRSLSLEQIKCNQNNKLKIAALASERLRVKKSFALLHSYRDIIFSSFI